MIGSDLTTLIEHLDARQLRERLIRLDRERSAVIVLLRAAISAERHDKRPTNASRIGRKGAPRG